MTTSHKTRSSYLGKPEAEVCPLCEREAALVQDHDHRNGLCRGSVCHSCNLLIGRYDRPRQDYQRFLDYLAFWSELHALNGGRAYADFLADTAAVRVRRQRPALEKAS